MTAAGDTIFALATPRGRGALAIIRVSGPASAEAVHRLTGRRPKTRGMSLARFRDPANGETLDRGVLLWFQAPYSVTGEDVAEFQIHGGMAVVGGLLEALGRIPGCRMAGPGEFTRRAFENGKLDLSAAEGVADLIEAETAAQRRQALRQAEGGAARLVEGWSKRLLRALAHVEAAIDFPEEEIPSDLIQPGREEAARLAVEIRDYLTDGRRGELLREGLSVAIIGPPNSGKSSLLNALAGREAAIVSAQAGTTRDIIEIRLDLGGFPVVLADTAGLRDSDDPIEGEGIRRAKARAAAADFTILLLDASHPVPRETFPALDPERCLIVWNKADLAPAPEQGITISVLRGVGLDRVMEALTGATKTLLAGPPALVTRHRHRAALEAAVGALHGAAEATESALIAEDLRLAVRALGQITGRVDVENVLDVIFGEFCIGK